MGNYHTKFDSPSNVTRCRHEVIARVLTIGVPSRHGVSRHHVLSRHSDRRPRPVGSNICSCRSPSRCNRRPLRAGTWTEPTSRIGQRRSLRISIADIAPMVADDLTDTRAEHDDGLLYSLRDAIRAVNHGDFSVRLPSNGGTAPIDEVALAFNVLVEKHEMLAREIGRVASVIGSEGRTAERATLGSATGSWAATLGAVNSLVESMAFPIGAATHILNLVANGDLSKDLPLHLGKHALQGDFRQLGKTVNAVMDRLRTVSSGVSRVVREMGTEGKLGGAGRASDGLSGTWKDLVDDVNLLAGNLTAQVRNIALVSTAIANGDLSQKITVETRGRDPRAQERDQRHGRSAAHVRGRGHPRRARGRHRRQARGAGRRAGRLRRVAGAHRQRQPARRQPDVARSATSPRSSTAIANGDLSQKITVEAKGEILELEEHDQRHGRPAAVVRRGGDPRRARGRHRRASSARRPTCKGVSGTWKDLTDNVNLLAGNLTDQVRNIALVDDRRRQRRPVAEDHRRGEGRDPRAQEHHQRDGRSPADLRRRGHARREGGRHRGQARRSGRHQGRLGHLEGPHRQREPAWPAT